MPVTYVGAGAVATATATTLTVAAPAGLAGDLLVFILMHDDFGDSSAGVTATVAPVAVTKLAINQTDLNNTPNTDIDDSKPFVFYCIHDQDAAENWTFGTIVSEEFKGVCLRFRGAHATTPILIAATRTDRTQNLDWWPMTYADEWGSMWVGFRWDDIAPGVQTPPTGWDERVDSSATNFSLYVATKGAINYPFPSAFVLNERAASGDLMGGTTFTIAPAASTAYTIAGVTKDNAGAVLVSCQVSLFRERSTGVFEYVATQVSNGATGAYSFTVYENPASFMVYARKAGTPNVFDATDYNLTPTV